MLPIKLVLISLISYNSACNESGNRTKKACGKEHQHSVDVLHLENLNSAGGLVIMGLPHPGMGAAFIRKRDKLPEMDNLFIFGFQLIKQSGIKTIKM